MNGIALKAAIILVALTSMIRAEEAAFQFSREIKPPSLTQEELLAVTLDTEIFANVRDGFPDLRLQDDTGRPTPFVLRKAQTTKTHKVRNTWTPQQFTAKPLSEGGLEILVQLSEKEPAADGLRLVTALRDFEQRVRVDTSTDGKQWEPTGDETLIFDYSRYLDVRNDSIAFPATTRRHFRIVIDDVTVEQESELLTLTRRLQGKEETERTEKTEIDRRPFRIERLEFRQEVQQEQAAGEAKATYPLAVPRVTEDAEKKQTVIQIAGRRQPLTSLELTTSDRNFSRRVAVEVPTLHGTSKSWRQIGSATLSRVDFKNLRREERTISFPESRQTEYRLVIDNRDSPPLQVASVEATGNVYELIYLAAPDRQYRLFYGSAEVAPASYDTAAVQELLTAGFQPKRAEWGEPTPGLKIEAAPPSFRWTDLLNNRLLLAGVAALLVVALGWTLFRAVKRMDAMPRE